MFSKAVLFATFTRRFGTIVSLEGNIASGKTSVIYELKKLLPHCKVHEEPVNKWRNLAGQNIFDLMYKDTKRWGFLFQSYVQLTMFSIHQSVVDSAQRASNQQPLHILERSIYSARYCFVENFKQNKRMADVEIQVIDSWFQFLTQENRCPVNLIVYLRTSPDCVHKRIIQRGRPEERVVDLTYIEQLHDLHEKWLLPNLTERSVPVVNGAVISSDRPLLPKCPVLVIDATKPWEMVLAQLRDIVVPNIVNVSSLRQSYCTN